MNESHTPGPWELEPGDDGDRSIGMSGTPPIIYATGPNGPDDQTVEICIIREPIYRVTPEDIDDDGQRYLGNAPANARLIAAAPDLLQALQRVSLLPLSHGVDLPDEVLSQIVRAIVLATEIPSEQEKTAESAPFQGGSTVVSR